MPLAYEGERKNSGTPNVVLAAGLFYLFGNERPNLRRRVGALARTDLRDDDAGALRQGDHFDTGVSRSAGEQAHDSETQNLFHKSYILIE